MEVEVIDGSRTIRTKSISEESIRQERNSHGIKQTADYITESTFSVNYL